MSDCEQKRRGTLRRNINAFGMRNGEPEESKLFALIGKCLCIWLIWKYADALIAHENVLFVLMLFLIFPELIKKFITMRYGNGHSEYREASNKIIAPEVEEALTELKRKG